MRPPSRLYYPPHAPPSASAATLTLDPPPLTALSRRCAFCVILGDTIPHVLDSILPGESPHTGVVGFFISRPVVVSLLTLGISYPLSLYRDIENLSKASALALVR